MNVDEQHHLNFAIGVFLSKELFDNAVMILWHQFTPHPSPAKYTRHNARSILHRKTCNHCTRRQTRQLDGYLGKLRHTTGKQSPEQNRSPLSSWEEAIHQHEKLCIPTTRSHTNGFRHSTSSCGVANSNVPIQPVQL